MDETGSGALLIQENQRGSTTDPPTSKSSISPRPLVRKKSKYNQKTVSEEDNRCPEIVNAPRANKT